MAVFKLPVKKKHKKDNFFSPLPIPISNESFLGCAKRDWSFYEAQLNNGHLLIENSGDVHELTTNGFFGKLINCKENATKNAEVTDTFSGDCNILDPSNFDKELVKNSFLMNENSSSVLHLNYYEGFFLSYGLGCLFIKDNKENLSIMKQWSYFCSTSSLFPILYAAYHHFRSKGWVPKDGIRYGADFLLYRKGPPYYHASYIVVVKCVCAESLKPLGYNVTNKRNFSWESLSGIMRLATTVSKEVMFCYVGIPADLQKTKIGLSDLNRLSINENIVSRWVSSKEREKELFDIDCDF